MPSSTGTGLVTVEGITRACRAAAGCSYVLWGPPLCYGAHPCRAPQPFSPPVLGLTHMNTPPGPWLLASGWVQSTGSPGRSLGERETASGQCLP